MQRPHEARLKHILRVRSLARGRTEAAPNDSEQAVSVCQAQFFECPLVAASGLFDKLLFS